MAKARSPETMRGREFAPLLLGAQAQDRRRLPIADPMRADRYDGQHLLQHHVAVERGAFAAAIGQVMPIQPRLPTSRRSPRSKPIQE